jgi:transposase-like protein
VPPKAQHRRFSAEYKQRILRLAEGCTEPGEVGALLRREGLYSSHLSIWRAQRDRGELAGLAPKKRGRKPDLDKPSAREIARLRRDNERLREQLRKAETVIDVQKKLSTLLGIELPSQDDSRSNG